MSGLMGLSKDADLRTLASSAYVFFAPDDDVIHIDENKPG
jgi:hypothetical protein